MQFVVAAVVVVVVVVVGVGVVVVVVAAAVVDVPDARINAATTRNRPPILQISLAVLRKVSLCNVPIEVPGYLP